MPYDEKSPYNVSQKGTPAYVPPNDDPWDEHLHTERRQGLIGMGSKTANYPASKSWVTITHPDTDPAYRKDDLYRAKCKSCGPVVTHNDYDIVHAMASDHQTEHQRKEHDDLFGQGAHENDFPHLYSNLRTAMSDGSTTDGKIVGNCPGCSKPIRRHQTKAHDDEFRHLHNNHVRCYGDSKTAAEGAGILEAADAGQHLLNDAEKGLEKPPDEWAYKAEAAHRMYADYLGRPDAQNPTGRGPDEYKARTWNAYETTKPMQSIEDRNINTPVLPSEPIKTRNINTPTRGLRGEEGDMRHSEDDDDNDED